MNRLFWIVIAAIGITVLLLMINNDAGTEAVISLSELNQRQVSRAIV